MAGDLERRLQLLEDERAILRLLHRYPHAIDHGGDAAWADVFTADGVFDARDRTGAASRVLRGRAELVAFATAFSRPPGRWHKHLVVDPLIEIDGDEARVEAYVVVLVEHEGVPRVWLFGRYHDRLRREADGAWRIAHRIAEVESADPEVPPLAFSAGRR